MFLLTYVSSATQLFSEEDLVKLLEKSRRNNHALGITGLLLYRDGNFMQLLEGEKETVLALAAKIEQDPRHHGFLPLIQQEQTEREFPDWAMGFKKMNLETLPAGYSDFLDLPLTSEEFRLHPSKSLRLLLSFKKSMR